VKDIMVLKTDSVVLTPEVTEIFVSNSKSSFLNPTKFAALSDLPAIACSPSVDQWNYQ
jgi:hypothetical protein